jgi:hypothetical protein
MFSMITKSDQLGHLIACMGTFLYRKPVFNSPERKTRRK